MLGIKDTLKNILPSIIVVVIIIDDTTMGIIPTKNTTKNGLLKFLENSSCGTKRGLMGRVCGKKNLEER